MNKQKIWAMALSAVSAGILISCAKVADKADEVETDAQENKLPDTDTQTSQEVIPKVVAVDISQEQAQQYLQHVYDGVILPAYQQVATDNKTLHDEAKSICQTGTVDAQGLEVLRQHWLQLAKSWAQAEAINFGSATENMSHLYINYFPDERGLVHRTVADLIANNPELTTEKLAQESAIAQGLPGLEEVLFANDSLDAAQCAYVISGSEALDNRLSSIIESWQNSGTDMLSIDNESNAGMNQWFNSLLSFVETLKSTGVDKPLGLSGHPKGHVPANTAAKSNAIIAAKLQMLLDSFSDPQLAALFNEDKQTIEEIIQTIKETQAQLAQMPEDISEADASQQQALLDNLVRIIRHIKRQLMPQLSVQVGFNSTDGD